MKLHEDSDYFMGIIDYVHETSGLRLDVLEKDYYVVLFLEELAKKQTNGLRAYFKGGTALYKALHLTNRFSEDIDLSVDIRDCTSRTQGDKRLELAAKKSDVMERIPGEGRTNRSEVIAYYSYEPKTMYDQNDALQRFGKLMVEATSFTISEPIEEMEVAPLVYELSDAKFRKELEDSYDVRPFKVLTISMDRIFVDKLFAAESYARKSSDKSRAFECAKHIYDLAVMSKIPRIQQLIRDENKMDRLIQIRISEEMNRRDGIPGIMPKDFMFFDSILTNHNVQSAYDVMQHQYVLSKRDEIPYSIAVSAIIEIHNLLQNNMAWTKNREKSQDTSPINKRQKAIEPVKPKGPKM